MSNTRKGASFRKAPQRTANTSKFQQKKSPIFVHPEDWSQHELIVNLATFSLEVGDVVEIVTNNTNDHTEEPLYLRVESVAMEKVKVTNNMHITILKSVADLYDLQPRKEVFVRAITPSIACLDYVEISFKDHFISRSDMWRFTLFLDNKAIFKGKIIQWNGIKAQVKELMRNGQRVRSGIIINNTTKITFRSRSAILYWLFQASKEMWDYADDGTLYFEKAVRHYNKL
jgi:hypothetical protein